jgi:hypothetical protein
VLVSATFLIVVLLAIPRLLTDKSEWRDLGIFAVAYYGVIAAAVFAAFVVTLIKGWRRLRGRKTVVKEAALVGTKQFT